MQKAFGYVRVSGKPQADEDRDGLQRQRIAIRDFAKKTGFNLERIFEERGVSGKMELENRPALQELIEALTSNGVKTVIIEKLDRLARDLMIQERIIGEMQKCGFSLISVCEPDLLSEDPSRVLVRQMFGAFAEYERKMIVTKLKVARQRKKQKYGKCEGRKKFGEEPGQAEILKEMIQLYRAGKTPNWIANFFNADLAKYPTATVPKEGKVFLWRAATVQRILKRTKTEEKKPL